MICSKMIILTKNYIYLKINIKDNEKKNYFIENIHLTALIIYHDIYCSSGHLSKRYILISYYKDRFSCNVAHGTTL